MERSPQKSDSIKENPSAENFKQRMSEIPSVHKAACGSTENK